MHEQDVVQCAAGTLETQSSWFHSGTYNTPHDSYLFELEKSDVSEHRQPVLKQIRIRGNQIYSQIFLLSRAETDFIELIHW